MFCKNCGNKIDDDARFCKKCGIQISNNDSTKKDDSLHVVHEFHYSNYGKEYEERMRTKRNLKSSVRILAFKITLSIFLGLVTSLSLLFGNEYSSLYVYGLLSVVLIIGIWALPIIIKRIKK